MKKIIFLIPLFLVACNAGNEGSHLIEDSAKKCNLESNLEDNGSTLVIDTQGEEDSSGDSYEDLACFLLALKIPDRIINKIENTRALDGMLEDSWQLIGTAHAFKATWTYHPDDGLNMIVYWDK